MPLTHNISFGSLTEYFFAMDVHSDDDDDDMSSIIPSEPCTKALNDRSSLAEQPSPMACIRHHSSQDSTEDSSSSASTAVPDLQESTSTIMSLASLDEFLRELAFEEAPQRSTAPPAPQVVKNNFNKTPPRRELAKSQTSLEESAGTPLTQATTICSLSSTEDMPVPPSLETNKSSLKFAASIKPIEPKTTVSQRVDPSALLARMRSGLAEKKKALRKLQSRRRAVSKPDDNSSSIPKFLKLLPVFNDESLETMSSSSEEQPSESRTIASGLSEAVFGEVLEDANWMKPRAMVASEPSSCPPVSEIEIAVEELVKTNRIGGLEDAEQRVKYLEDKLDATDDLVVSLFRDLKDTRRCNDELKELCAQMEAQRGVGQKKGGELTTEVEQMLKHYKLMKKCLCLGLGFLALGRMDLFWVAIAFMCLSMTVVA